LKRSKEIYLKTKSYTDWSLGIHNLSVKKRVPLTATIELTRRCNNSCVHCYNNLPLHDPFAHQNEMSAAEHFRILDEIAAAGCLWILFTGGEILARRDFLDIYTYAKQQGFLITLFTNGTLITPDMADYLVELPPFNIEITLYGYSRGTYEKVTGGPGSYDRCLRGIRLLKERHLPLKLKSMALTVNQDEIWRMKHFAEEDLGLEFRFDALINPRYDCSQSPLKVRLSPLDVVKMDLLDPKRVAEWQKFSTQFGGPPKSVEETRRLWRCGGGLNNFAIDPYGMLRICSMSQDDAFDLRQGNFQEGWEQGILQLRQKPISRQTKCVACGIRSMCGMCPANAQLECMDSEIPVDYLCQVAHLRAYAFDIPVSPHGDCEYCKGGSKYAEMMQQVEKLKQVQDSAQSAPL
jgi:radical SAM protein with 4Fe4S-binding SPASM domain